MEEWGGQARVISSEHPRRRPGQAQHGGGPVTRTCRLLYGGCQHVVPHSARGDTPQAEARMNSQTGRLPPLVYTFRNTSTRVCLWPQTGVGRCSVVQLAGQLVLPLGVVCCSRSERPPVPALAGARLPEDRLQVKANSAAASTRSGVLAAAAAARQPDLQAGAATSPTAPENTLFPVCLSPPGLTPFLGGSQWRKTMTDARSNGATALLWKPIQDVQQNWRLSLASLLFFTIFLTNHFGLSSSYSPSSAQQKQSRVVAESSSPYRDYWSSAMSAITVSYQCLHIQTNFSDEICSKPTKERMPALRGSYFRFCKSTSLFTALPYLAELEPRLGDCQDLENIPKDQCVDCIATLEKLDTNAYANYCHFTDILSRVDCETTFSSHWNCTDCKVRKQWE